MRILKLLDVIKSISNEFLGDSLWIFTLKLSFWCNQIWTVVIPPFVHPTKALFIWIKQMRIRNPQKLCRPKEILTEIEFEVKDFYKSNLLRSHKPIEI